MDADYRKAFFFKKSCSVWTCICISTFYNSNKNKLSLQSLSFSLFSFLSFSPLGFSFILPFSLSLSLSLPFSLSLSLIFSSAMPFKFWEFKFYFILPGIFTQNHTTNMYNGFNIFLISFRFRVIFDKLADQKPKSNIFSFFWEGSTKVVIDKKKI